MTDPHDAAAGWYQPTGEPTAWWWWNGNRWTTRMEWDGREWSEHPIATRREGPTGIGATIALSQPWLLIFVTFVVLSVVGVAAGVASWHSDTIDATGCQTDSSVTPLTIVLWLWGIAIGVGAVMLGRRWSIRSGNERRIPLEALLLMPAAALPWLVYVAGFNQCWN